MPSCVPSGLFLLPSLCVLDVSGNPLLAEDTQESDSGGFGQLAASLSHAPGLSKLVLQGCGLTSHGLKSLGTKTSIIIIIINY